MNSFNSVSENLFFTKNDPQDLRLGDLVTNFKSYSNNKNQKKFYLLGYPDDEGIKLNGGRTGASEAPLKIREFLYKMTPPQTKENLQMSLTDIGNLVSNESLAQRHEIAKNKVKEILTNDGLFISFGGGHDYGYSDAVGFVEYYKSKNIKPIVINFDAHLDVRPTDMGFNSGTPFYRLLSQHKNDVHFFEVGLQPQCNSIHHRSWAKNHGAHLFDLATIVSNNGLSFLLNSQEFQNLIHHQNNTPLFISFDIDCLSSTEAGGCSQSWVTGLKTQDFLNFFHTLKHKVNICGLGIYEVSPVLDTDHRTSKAAALIAYNYLFQDSLP